MARTHHTYTAAEHTLMQKMQSEGSSYRQIAERLGITLGAVKSALYKLRHKSVMKAAPKVSKIWPPYTDYSPDNLEVRA